MLILSNTVSAELYFDPSMISGDVADLSRFSREGTQVPGIYDVDIYINGRNISTRAIRFAPADTSQIPERSATHDATGLIACFTAADITELGINPATIPDLSGMPAEQCISLSDHIAQAYTKFDFQRMRLDISVPQAAMSNLPRDWIPPERWDHGINAALLSWQFNGSENRGKYGNSRSQFLNLTSGLNIGAWRLRDNSTWRNNESNDRRQQQWQHLRTYVQRSIIPWRSELTLGDSSTDSDIFDAFSFRGLQLATDDNMYPDSMRGFAPVIKGAAASTSEVSIRQNGNVIYRTFVAPGAFVIRDLNSLPSGGDLQVSIAGADGTVQTFTVPYSSVPVLQREDRYRYAMTLGRYRNASHSYDDPQFFQSTLMWGLPNNITAYGGTQLAENYHAVALGAGMNMGAWGAISTDITHADSTLANGSQHEGQSVRFLYSRSLISSGTSFRLAGYRFSTEGFYTLSETALKRMSGWIDDTGTVDAAGRPVEKNWANYYNLYGNKRGRVQATVSQRLGSLGTLYLTGNRQSYWNDSGSALSVQAGISSSFSNVSYSLTYGYSRYSDQPKADKTLYLSLSVPLEPLLSGKTSERNARSTHATFSSTRDRDGNLSHRSGINGTALEDGNLSWNVSQGYSRQDRESGDAGLAYQGPYGNASVGYGYSRHYRQARYGLSGSAVLHGDGLTFGQPLGTTNVLVAAPGAASVPVENSTGIRTDWRGYAIVPYASMYRENQTALDVRKLDDQSDIDSAVSHNVPTRGALVRADFKVRSGIRAMVTLTKNNKPLPFGTVVMSADGNSSGLVGEDGVVYLSGLLPQGELKAQWGQQSDRQCSVRYALTETDHKGSLIRFHSVCE